MFRHSLLEERLGKTMVPRWRLQNAYRSLSWDLLLAPVCLSDKHRSWWSPNTTKNSGSTRHVYIVSIYGVKKKMSPNQIFCPHILLIFSPRVWYSYSNLFCDLKEHANMAPWWRKCKISYCTNYFADISFLVRIFPKYLVKKEPTFMLEWESARRRTSCRKVVTSSAAHLISSAILVQLYLSSYISPAILVQLH
jgi:hypothetical protein